MRKIFLIFLISFCFTSTAVWGAGSIFDSRNLRQHLSPTINQPIAYVNVTFVDTVIALISHTYSPLNEKISNMTTFINIDLDYHPKDHLEGYEKYYMILLYAHDAGHMASLKRALVENRKRRIILENSW